MPDKLPPATSWQDIARELVQEDDGSRVLQLAKELTRALDEEREKIRKNDMSNSAAA